MSDVIYDGRRMSLEEAQDRYEEENAGRGWEEPEFSPGPNDVVFTQFLREDRKNGYRAGQRRRVWIDVTPELKAKADALVAAGYSFQCEELTDGRVHLDCCNAEGVLANRVVRNGPPVPDAVADVIARSHLKWAGL